MRSAAIILILLVVIYATSKSIDSDREKAGISPRRVVASGRFMGPAILGFADLAADALWLVANEYFWNKEYLKLVPLFRTITWLDPHYVLVYKIGGWHLAYNVRHVIECTEEKARELVKSGIKFLEEGIENNPHKFDLYFELGWLYFEKEKDYGPAAEYFRKAIEFEHPIYVDHMLAHAYQRNGDIEKALKEWKRMIETNPRDMVAIKQYERLKEFGGK